jgi:hypothetical protein
MIMPYDLIRNKAKGYFETEFIESFIKVIEKWAVTSRIWFVQVVQKGDKPTLEFGCVTGEALFDATASIEKTETCIMPMSSLKYVSRQETGNSTHLRLTGEALSGFDYLAVTDEYRQQLRQYADFIESLVLGK